jgi:uncharacterized protein YndB with AHSA1/START domain
VRIDRNPEEGARQVLPYDEVRKERTMTDQPDLTGASESPTPPQQQMSRLIHAPASAIYRAVTEPDLIVQWQAPGEMTAHVEPFADGSGYQMTLRYPETEDAATGKSGEREDRYTARYLTREPGRHVVEAITFETDDPAFSGTMLYTITLEATSEGTLVTMAYGNLPPGIRPEDNELGTRLSFANLAALVERGDAMEEESGD